MATHFDPKNLINNTNYVIEASAGTGKTHNIIEIVKRLVNDFNIPLDKILIVTFTDKAAGELKNRIRAELSDIDVDNAPIFTIHSFCQNTIKRFGLSANLPLDLGTVSDSDLYRFADKYVRQGDILKDIFAYTSIETKNKVDFSRLVKLLCKSLNLYYLDKEYKEDKSIIRIEKQDEIEQSYDEICLKSTTASSIDELARDNKLLTKYLNILKNSNDDATKRFYDELNRCYNKTFKFSNFRTTSLDFKSIKKDPEAEEAYYYFYNLKESNGYVEKKFKVYKYLTRKYLKDFYVKWQEYKEQKKVQSFNDMIRSIREALMDKDNNLINKLRDTYTYGIIDEFQDTNQIQYDIFGKIFLTEGRNLIVVGDPKQSIYAFQGADIEVYRNAIKDFKSKNGCICDLIKNFRSTSTIVDSCNKIFSTDSFFGSSFVPSDWLKESDKLGEHKAYYDGAEAKAFWIDNEDNLNQQSYAKTVVQTIINCCKLDQNNKTKLRIKDKGDEEERNVKFEDFTVLVEKRAEADEIVKALTEAGIPTLKYKNKDLYNGKQCTDFITLLQALNVPDFSAYNRKTIKKVLLTNFFDYSLKMASNSRFDNDSSIEIQLLKHWKDLADQKRWEDLFDDIIVESGIVDRMTSLNKNSLLGKYKQIANYCIEYLSNNHSILDLINQLKFLRDNYNDDEDEGSLVERITDFGCVQVMTIHASKGLQFPVVIFASGYSSFKKEDVCTYHDRINNTQVLTFNQNQQCIDEKKEELKRLFYVAFTRAQFVLILPVFNVVDLNKKFLKDAYIDYINSYDGEYMLIKDNGDDLKDYVTISADIISRSSTINTPSIEEIEAHKKEIEKVKKSSNEIETFKHSYSSFTHPKNDDEEIEVDGLKDIDPKSVQILLDLKESDNNSFNFNHYPKGKGPGNALHKVFEKIDFTNPDEYLKDIIISSFNNEYYSLNEEQVKLTEDVVKNVLKADLPVINGSKSVDETFKLDSIHKKIKLSETEFYFNYENETLRNYCNGFIDLLLKRGEYYCIADWKSDSLNEDFTSYTSNEELKEHVDNLYSIQRVLYSYCLIKWLKEAYKDLSYEEIFEQHFGGIYYIFIRGCNKDTSAGIYAQTWNSFKDLEEAYLNLTNKKGDSNE